MNIKIRAIALALTMATSIAWSHDDERYTVVPISGGHAAAPADISVPADAAAAVATIERFSGALSAGDLDRAAAELDPAVIILESGGVERSRDEYLSGHAKSDAEFLKTAQVTLKRRSAHVSADVVWVASESAIHSMQGEEKLLLDSTETMIVQKTKTGWKIVHIHWSSRRSSPTR